MAYIKRFFGTVYFKRATCYLWRVERLCVYDQNANTTNLHSVILDDGIAKYFGLRLEYILDDTTRLTVFFWEMKTNIYFTYFWHMTHFIMIFPAMAWIDRRILRWKIAKMALTKWIIFSVGIVWEKCIQCQKSSEKWRYFMNLNLFVIIFFLKKIEVHFHNLVFLIHVTNYTRLISDLDENYQNYLSLILFVLRSWTHTPCLFYVGKADTIYQYTRHNLIFSSFNSHNIRFIIYVCMNNENNYEQKHLLLSLSLSLLFVACNGCHYYFWEHFY